jgi:hypothetical protein
VAPIGEPALCDWYLKAFVHRGLAAMAYDGGAAVLSGLTALNAQRNAR